MNFLGQIDKIITGILIILSSIFALLTTKFAFSSFDNEGIIELGNILNFIALIYIFSSLSIESGLIRKFVSIESIHFKDLAISLIILYLLGFFFSTLFAYFNGLFSNYIIKVIPLLILYFPLIVIRSNFIAQGRQHLAALITSLLSLSYFLGTYFTSDLSDLFLNIILANYLIIFCAISSYLTYLIIRKIIIFERFRFYLPNKNHFKESLNLIRYGLHSSFSGLQENTAMLIRRIFLINYISLEFSSLMEMYQRPMIWLLSLATAVISYYFYPFIINSEVSLAGKNTSESNQIIKKNLNLIFKITLLSLIYFSFCFPIIFWLTFGYINNINFFYASFWIFIFTLRVTAALFSSWMLAKNKIKNAVYGELILYFPAIIIFYSIPTLGSSLINSHLLFFLILSLSSIFQIIFFVLIIFKDFKVNSLKRIY